LFALNHEDRLRAGFVQEFLWKERIMGKGLQFAFVCDVILSGGEAGARDRASVGPDEEANRLDYAAGS
jgi:hypothetical protein